MVERGPSFEQNSEIIETPQTGGEQPYVAPIEQPAPSQELPAVSVPQITPEQSTPEALKSYNIDAVASGSETLDTLDLQTLMKSQFEHANDSEDNEQLPNAA